jgi:RimJ/RimL family protein N-acetyltransferase
MEPLTTERLQFRPILTEDFEAVHDALSDPEVMRFYPGGAFDAEETRAWLERTLARYDGGELGFRAVIHRKSGDYLGHIGLLPQEVEGSAYIEVGYWLRRRFWGRGFATEGARALRDVAFRRLDVPKVVSLIHPENVPSQAVALRNGMRREREVTWRGRAHFLYSIERGVWENLPRTGSR